MIRVGVVGTDGHGRSFTSAFNGVPDGEPNVEGARVTCVWSRDSNEAHQFASSYAIPTIATEPIKMLGEVDAVLVLDDEGHGDSHVRLAHPFLEAGVPTFIDRPIAPTLDAAYQLFETAKNHKAPLMTGSSLRYAHELNILSRELHRLGSISSVVATGPGDWWFYGLHTVELYQVISGPGVDWVHRHHFDDRDVVIISHSRGHTGVIQLLRDGRELFHVTVYGEQGISSHSIRDHWQEAGDAGPHTFRTRMMTAFVEMARTGIPPTSREESLEVMAILHAGLQSTSRGERISLEDLSPRDE